MSVRGVIAENPFYVLGLGVDSSRLEIEREGQKLIGMLELGLASARSYATPLGARDRDVDLVRRSMAELRDPERRLKHEVWARLEARVVVELEDGAGEGPEAPPAWREALEVFGWGKL